MGQVKRLELTKIIVCILLILLSLTSDLWALEDNNALRIQARTNVAMSLHEDAWIEVVDKAKSDPLYKYAIYQSRTIAVKHPELYLQADALFNKILTSEDNMGRYYDNRTQDAIKQEEEYRRIRGRVGGKFSWSRFSITDHKEIGYKEIYHTDAFLPFVDMRLHFMGSSLKGTDWQATPLSMAELLYFQNGAKKNSFLLVTENGSAYVYCPPGLFAKEKLLKYTGEECESIEGNVILIFNENHVWYPLMDRDDRTRSQRLSQLVETYAREGQIPKLTTKEKEIVAKLRENTQFDSKKDELFALAYAAKLHAFSWRFFPEIFQRIDPDYANAYGFNRSHAPEFLTYRNAQVAWISNLVSPITSELASIAKENVWSSLNGIVSPMIGEYIQHTETYPNRTGLTLWNHSELHYLNLDDSLLSRGANCIMSATNAAAMLDLANIPGLEIFVVGMKYEKRGGGHAYTVIARGSDIGTLENGEWAPNFNGFYEQRYFEREGTCISAITSRDGWVQFSNVQNVDIREITSSLDTKEIMVILEYLREKTRGNTRISTIHSSEKAHKVHGINDFIARLPHMSIRSYPF